MSSNNDGMADPAPKKTRKSGGGGNRSNSGRKPVSGDSPTISRTVTVPPEDRDFLMALGDGNMSAGIRKVIALYKACSS